MDIRERHAAPIASGMTTMATDGSTPQRQGLRSPARLARQMGKVALLVLALPALLAGCLAGAQPPAPPTGQIDGAVVDHLLRPFANQTVYLSPLGWRDSTSALGGFTFRDVPVGSYTLLTAHEGTLGAGASVTVEAGRITKAILQLLPVRTKDPSMAIFPSHAGYEDVAFAGMECASCSWTVPLDGERPAEAVLEAHWDARQFGHDALHFRIRDDRGHTLSDAVASEPPFLASVDGSDIPADATALQVTVSFGQDFLARPQFRMDSTMTLYYGATREQMFGA
jgi:hypothetical protein